MLGYRLCPVAGCAAAVETSGLCHACRLRFGRFQGTFDEFIRSSRCATRCARRSASATRARERVARRDIEEAPPSHGRGIVRSTANPGGLGPLPLRASGSHRSPSQHPHHDTSRVSQPRIVASDQSGSEAVSTRDAHPHAPDPTLHCRPLAVRSRTCSRSYFFFRNPPPCPRTTAPTCRNSAALNSPSGEARYCGNAAPAGRRPLPPPHSHSHTAEAAAPAPSCPSAWTCRATRRPPSTPRFLTARHPWPRSTPPLRATARDFLVHFVPR